MTPAELGQRMTVAEFRELLTVYALENEEYEAQKKKNKANKGR